MSLTLRRIAFFLLLFLALPLSAIGAALIPQDEAASIVLTPIEPQSFNAKIAPEILNILQENPSAKIPIIVYLTEQANLQAVNSFADKFDRRQAVYTTLTQVAAKSQRRLTTSLQTQSDRGKLEEIINFWIFNGFSAHAEAETIFALASAPEVKFVYLDGEVEILDESQVALDESQTPIEVAWNTEAEIGSASSVSAIEWGVARIQAERVWNELGYTGRGVVVGGIDTGVLWTHNALKNQYRGWNGVAVDHTYSFADCVDMPCTTVSAYDDNSHGTHTMGIIVGDDNGVNQIGVAPGARWIAAKAFRANGSGSDSDILNAMQWMLAPGGNPAMAPDLVNNSWGAPSCLETYRAAIQAWRAAGIIPVISSGNVWTGAGPASVFRPACYPESLAVGAVDANDLIAYFSARGPSPYSEIKPEVSAPGVSIRSSTNSGIGNYTLKTGTSQAAPHVSGVIALMLQANPSLNFDQVETALKNTAVDLGASGADNDYGWGRIDAFRAVSSVVSPFTPRLREPRGVPIGAQGGSLHKYRLSLSIMAGTLPDGSLVYIELRGSSAGPQVSDGMRPLGYLYEINVWAPDGDLITTFTPPLYLCLNYTSTDLDAAGGNPDNLIIASARRGDDEWTLLPTTSRSDREQVCAWIDHLSFFRLFVASLPATGFALDGTTSLPAQPADKAYFTLSSSDLLLEIPRLGLQLPILGIPLSGNGWDLTWLTNQVGYLAGTAFPTHPGNTVLTAHASLPSGEPGPFADLATLTRGDQIILHAWGRRYVYEIQTTRRLPPQDLSALGHSQDDIITLITCSDYNRWSRTYLYRIAMQAARIYVEE